MKLKKIASLALAGVMAVSMLAGCKGNDSSTGNQGTVVVPTTSNVVTALNDGQTPGNEVKVTFTAANSLISDSLAKAVKYMGSSVGDADLQTQVLNFAGGSVGAWGFGVTNGFYGDALSERLAFSGSYSSGLTNDSTSLEKVSPVTLAKVYGVDDALTEEAAIAKFVNAMDDELAKLVADDVVTDAAKKEKVGTTGYELTVNKDQNAYHVYDYTGSVAMVSETEADGTTNYYFVMAVTQTVTQKTLEK